MKVLAIDIGGTHVNLLVAGQQPRSEFDSSPNLTARFCWRVPGWLERY